MSAEGKVDLEKIAVGVRLILEGIGEDASRKGILETPQRVAECTRRYAAGCMKTRLLN